MMFKLILLALAMLLTSCASMSGEYGPWYRVDVATDKREWRFCTEDYDGAQYAMKGLCYSYQECRDYKTIFGNVREEKRQCKKITDHCAWGDLTCMGKHRLWQMKILNKEK